MDNCGVEYWLVRLSPKGVMKGERANMSDVVIGSTTTQRGTAEPLRIKSADRRHHAYVVGKSGVGKSTLIRNMAIQDMRNGNGVGVIDPHGDLIEDLLDHVPKSRTDDVMYVNPADAQHPIGFNMLEVRDDQDKELIASSIISVFRISWIAMLSANQELGNQP